MSSPLVVANWKMYGDQAQCALLARQIVRALRRNPARAEIVLAPPFTSLNAVRRSLGGSKVRLAAQNCHWEAQGAYTGEISPIMVRELGCDYVIVGHSERRHHISRKRRYDCPQAGTDNRARACGLFYALAKLWTNANQEKPRQ